MYPIVSPTPLALFQKEKAAKKKDPNAPKKALSPYMFFTQEHREIIKEENPGIGFGMCLLRYVLPSLTSLSTGEVAKKLGAKWKSMTDEDKEVRVVSIPAIPSVLITIYSPMSRSTRPIRSALKRPRRLTRCVYFPLLSNNLLTHPSSTVQVKGRCYRKWRRR
jgi:HMG-box domain